MRLGVVLDLFLASLGAAALAALAHALLWPALPGLHFLDVKWLLAFAGAAPIGLVASSLAAAWQRWRGRSRDADAAARLRAAAFWAPLWTGLAGVVGAWVFAWTNAGHAMRYAVLAGLALGIFLPASCAPARGLLRGLGALAVAAAALLVLGVGSRDRLDLAGFDPDRHRAPLPATTAAGAPPAGPDVLLISVDTLRADALLEPAVSLPALAALRARGMSADFGRAPTPSTLPSHVAMVTGTHPLDNGCYTNTGTLPADGPATLAELFREAGWRAAGVAANGLLDAHTGFTRGFEAFSNVVRSDPGAERITELMRSTRRMAPYALFLSDAATVGFGLRLAARRTNVPVRVDQMSLTADAPLVERVTQRYFDELYASPRPFFYFLHFMDPHLPYAPARESGMAGRLSGAAPLPGSYSSFGLLSTFFADEVRHDLAAADPAVRADAEAALAHARLVYLEELMAVDAALASIFARVEASGRPCLILFTSDHGEHFGEHGLTGHGNSLYEELLRVPFLFAGPGVPAGRFPVAPRLEDVPITLLHAAGIRPPGGVGRGRDLLDPALTEPTAFAAHENELAVLDGAWKSRFSWQCADPRGAPFTLLALVDLAQDPAESHDLAASAPEPAQRARELGEEARGRAAQRRTRAVSAEERRSLAELGYVFDEEGNVAQE